MKRIFKYIMQTSTQSFAMPIGAKILQAHNQHDRVVFWAEVDIAQSSELRKFTMYGTGHALPDDPGKYIGTVLIETDFLVMHLYEIT